ncbi:TetR/AcrR family transcriptional regulator [Leifsonia sp. SIMBA_070]|uniref:TetR/AcrR family transcriptional regulator n=1 Tax=Leifsonia sp. SIMBA_070 TaxID=3085810 RepID=UPI00397CAC3E
MTTETTLPRPKPRDRVLAAAARLFVREGVNAVGVDRLAQEAQVSKRSLYQHFDGKDAVVATMLQEYGPSVVAAYFVGDEEPSPRERALHVFDALHEAAQASDFYGCPFVNVATELRDREHPAAVVARHFKEALTAYFERQAEEAGARDPHLLAVQLTLLFDGASASAAMRGGTPDAARIAVAQLFDAATARSTGR